MTIQGYIYVAVALAVAALGGFAYWQYDRANGLAADLAVASAQLESANANAKLNDTVTVIAVQAKQANAVETATRKEKLNEASKANPVWADEPVPAAVADSLR